MEGIRMDYNKDRRSAKEKNNFYKQNSDSESHQTINQKIKLDVGTITLEQINLIFKHLPVDISYVDEFDQVQYYNRGEERIFSRSPGVIGRLVKYCHPPKSVDTVMEILKEFKEGKKDVAEFWFKMGAKFIFIQYFAVRDADKKYKGILEVSQEIAHLRNLEGEQKLLNWE